MKYAKEVIDLLGAYPGRQFVMRQIIRHINPSAERIERLAIQRAAHRALMAMQATGVIIIDKAAKFGGQAKYSWKC